MHGMPPSDIPREILSEWRNLHSEMEGAPAQELDQLRYLALDRQIRSWPRDVQNDPYFFASHRIAKHLKEQSQYEVIVAFNEFSAPTLEEGFDIASRMGVKKVVVITPMMTRGGSHSERDIPRAVEQARLKYPGMNLIYVWPFDEDQIAGFLNRQLAPYLEGLKS